MTSMPSSQAWSSPAPGSAIGELVGAGRRGGMNSPTTCTVQRSATSSRTCRMASSTFGSIEAWRLTLVRMAVTPCGDVVVDRWPGPAVDVVGVDGRRVGQPRLHRAHELARTGWAPRGSSPPCRGARAARPPRAAGPGPAVDDLGAVDDAVTRRGHAVHPGARPAEPATETIVPVTSSTRDGAAPAVGVDPAGQAPRRHGSGATISSLQRDDQPLATRRSDSVTVAPVARATSSARWPGCTGRTDRRRP